MFENYLEYMCETLPYYFLKVEVQNYYSHEKWHFKRRFG